MVYYITENMLENRSNRCPRSVQRSFGVWHGCRSIEHMPNSKIGVPMLHGLHDSFDIEYLVGIYIDHHVIIIFLNASSIGRIDF